MPPKKKIASKQTSNQETSSFSKQLLAKSSNITLPPNCPKIQKRPHFRYVDFDRLRRAQHIRVKFWKFRSFKLSRFVSEPKPTFLSRENQENEEKKKFENTFKSSTIKRSLKLIKRIYLNFLLFSKYRFLLQFCKSRALNAIDLEFPPTDKLKGLFNVLMNPKLKNCSLISNSESLTNQLNPHLVGSFRKLRNCNLLIKRRMNRLKILLNTDKLLSEGTNGQLVRMRQDPRCSFVSNYAMINAPNSIERISSHCSRTFMYKEISHLPPLPNLKDLQFVEHNLETSEIIDLSFLGQSLKLERLSIRLHSQRIGILDYLTNLPSLKDFSFHSSIQSSLDRLPNLTKLEKFSLQLTEPTLFTMKHIRSFISNNKDLKSLSLSLPIQNIGDIFEGGEDDDRNLPLPPIESLHLTLLPRQRLCADAAKTIAETLKKLVSIKQLSIRIEHSSAHINEILLKQGVASVKSLEEFRLKYYESGGQEYDKFKHLKNIFINLENLKALELDLSCSIISSGKFSSILDGLSRLKCLEKFIFIGKLGILTPATSNKFLNFLTSIRHLKSFHVSLQGITEEEGVKIKENLLPKFTLSQDPFPYISHA